MLLVPGSLLVELAGGGLVALGVVGHAAFVRRQLHFQFFGQGVKRGGVRDVGLGQSGSLGGVAIDQIVVVVGGVACCVCAAV